MSKEQQQQQHEEGTVVIFCGGTGMHGFVEQAARLRRKTLCVVAVSDDGGSSMEITRWFGGSSLGDLRNLSLKAAGGFVREQIRWCKKADEPVGELNEDLQTISVLQRRLTSNSALAASRELHDLIVARHASTKLNELMHYVASILPSRFDLRNASIGNLVLLAMWLQVAGGLLSSALAHFCKLCGLPDYFRIIPTIDARRITGVKPPAVVISVGFKDGTSLRGQKIISYGEDATATGPEAPDKKVVREGLTTPTSLDIHHETSSWGRREVLVSTGFLPPPHQVRMVVLGRGSFLTSTMAAVFPHRAWLASVSKQRGALAPIFLLTNATFDRETLWSQEEGRGAETTQDGLSSSPTQQLFSRVCQLLGVATVHCVVAEGSELHHSSSSPTAKALNQQSTTKVMAVPSLAEKPGFYDDAKLIYLLSLVKAKL